MIPEREEKGYGEGKKVTPGNISKTVLYGKGVPGLPFRPTVEGRVCMPKMWQPSGIPVGKWTVPVCPMPTSSLGDGRDSPA